MLSLVDQPDGETLAREVYDGRWACVPYIAPGFGLAKAAAQVFEQKPDVEGLVLHKHGIFTFGESACEAYERMIEMVSLAESRLRQGRPIVFPARQIAERHRDRSRSRRSSAAPAPSRRRARSRAASSPISAPLPRSSTM